MTTVNPNTQKHPKPTGRFKRLHSAINSAVAWHTGQDRKYTEVPYIIHPLRVMQIVRTVTDNEDMLIAAVLHDVVEDTYVTLETITKIYGKTVADLVWWLTDISKPEDGNRKARKALDRAHTAAATAEAQTIKLADLIDNSASITKHDPDFAHVFMCEMELLLEVLTLGDRELHTQAYGLVQQYQESRLQESLRRHG